MFRNMERFHDLIPSCAPASLGELDSRLRIFSDQHLEIWYSPIPRPVQRPSLWILGITPGWRQMQLAYEAAAEALRGGATGEEAVACPKPKVAFAGSMRANLIQMLDELDLHDVFNVTTVGELFGTARLRTGSVLKYPVFRSGKNYTGHAPEPTKHPALRQMLDVVLAEELRESGQELIVPLGKAVESVLARAVKRGQLDPRRILSGFPHPSGANGHRIRQFAMHRARLRRELLAWYEREA